VLLLLRWVPGAPIAGAWTAGLSLGSGDRRWGCATVEPGASVDSQVALCGCRVRLHSPRCCYHDHELSADRRGSLGFTGLFDCRPGCAHSSALWRLLRGAVRRRWVAKLTEVAKIDNRT
jgi:hypothetical protein